MLNDDLVFIMTTTNEMIHELINQPELNMPTYTCYKTRFEEINQDISELLKDFLSSIWVVTKQSPQIILGMEKNR